MGAPPAASKTRWWAKSAGGLVGVADDEISQGKAALCWTQSAAVILQEHQQRLGSKVCVGLCRTIKTGLEQIAFVGQPAALGGNESCMICDARPSSAPEAMLSLSLDANLVLKEWEHNGGGMFTPGHHAMDHQAWAPPNVPHMDTFQFDTAAVGENSCHSEHGESGHGASCAAVPSLNPFSRSGAHASSSGENDTPLGGIVPELFTAGSFDFGFDFGEAAGDSCLHADVFDKLLLMHNSKAPQQELRPAAATGFQSDDSAGVVPCVPFQHTSHGPTQPLPQQWQQQWQLVKQRRQLEEGSGSVDPPASPAAAVASTQHAPWYRSSACDTWNGTDDFAVVPDASCLGSMSGRDAQASGSKHRSSAAAAAAAAEAAAIAAAAALVPQAPTMPADLAPVGPKTSKRRAASSAQLSRSELQAMMEAAKPSAHAFEVPTVSPRPVMQAAASGDQQPEFHRTRAECLARYREKKARRSHAKKIRYHLRKINADKRPRVKGRFVKKEELAAYLASIGASAPNDDDEAAADSPASEQAPAASPASRRRGSVAAAGARNASDGNGSGRRGAAAYGSAKKATTGAAAAAALALHGGTGGSVLEMEQHDQMLYSMLALQGGDMDMLLDSDDELEQESMEQLMLVPTMPM